MVWLTRLLVSSFCFHCFLNVSQANISDNMFTFLLFFLFQKPSYFLIPWFLWSYVQMLCSVSGSLVCRTSCLDFHLNLPSQTASYFTFTTSSISSVRFPDFPKQSEILWCPHSCRARSISPSPRLSGSGRPLLKNKSLDNKDEKYQEEQRGAADSKAGVKTVRGKWKREA